MSCLQGQRQHDALAALLVLRPDGIQLTPGNLPTPGFEAEVREHAIPFRFHHGFAWDRYRRAVWDEAWAPIAIEHDRSVHGPRSDALDAASDRFASWLEDVAERDLLIETMYPGYVLGTGAALERAMDAGLRLAVDIAHLWIQRYHGVLPDRVHRRLLDYDRVEEIHVSTNEGRYDSHRPLHPDVADLGWARERQVDLPVVLESYWHRLDHGERERQLDFVRR